MTPAGSGLVLASEGAAYRLARKTATIANPPAQSSIVGYWRNATGYARFNADGTGMIDGNPGRHLIRGNQITLPFDLPRRRPHPDRRGSAGRAQPREGGGGRRRYSPRR